MGYVVVLMFIWKKKSTRVSSKYISDDVVFVHHRIHYFSFSQAQSLAPEAMFLVIINEIKWLQN
jgi:hypothetical protein